MARGTEGHGNLGEQKKNKRPEARVFVPPARGKNALAGGENTPGKNKKKFRVKFECFFSFVFIPTPSLGGLPLAEPKSEKERGFIP
jgi:hypothetical protein